MGGAARDKHRTGHERIEQNGQQSTTWAGTSGTTGRNRASKDCTEQAMGRSNERPNKRAPSIELSNNQTIEQSNNQTITRTFEHSNNQTLNQTID